MNMNTKHNNDDDDSDNVLLNVFDVLKTESSDIFINSFIPHSISVK